MPAKNSLPKEFMIAFGKRVKHHREKNKLEIIQVAQMAQCSASTLYYLEMGKWGTRIEILMKLCSIFKCTPNDLLPPVPKATIEQKDISRTIVKKTMTAKFKWS